MVASERGAHGWALRCMGVAVAGREDGGGGAAAKGRREAASRGRAVAAAVDAGEFVEGGEACAAARAVLLQQLCPLLRSGLVLEAEHGVLALGLPARLGARFEVRERERELQGTL